MNIVRYVDACPGMKPDNAYFWTEGEIIGKPVYDGCRRFKVLIQLPELEVPGIEATVLAKVVDATPVTSPEKTETKE